MFGTALGQIGMACFGEPNAMGMLRLRDNNALLEAANLTTFIMVLGKTFLPNNGDAASDWDNP